jgi:phosphoglycolate phosphatase
MGKPGALLFDLDGTLVDSAVMITSALTELSLSRGGEPAEVARIRRLVGRGAPTLVKEALGPVAGNSEEDVATFRAILADTPPQPGITFPGVVAALDVLAAAGHACAVVTNKPEMLARRLLDQSDMSRFFTVVVGGDTLPVGKPDPAPLHHALRALSGARATSATMIGDSDIDARAAAAAGIAFALFLGGYEPDRCNEETVAGTFDSFAQLPALVHRLHVSRIKKRAPQMLRTG